MPSLQLMDGDRYEVVGFVTLETSEVGLLTAWGMVLFAAKAETLPSKALPGGFSAPF